MIRCGLFLVLLMCAALGACSTTVLISKYDATFRRAEQRLERTENLVLEEEAAPAERLLFMQAEGFFRYRFDFPRRHALSYIAQVASATTDFPALQAVAGSFDLLELRLRTYDIAVQMWETLLVRYPNTNLRPLALYRLGWAYRSSGAIGFPRESGDEALRDLIREYPDSPLAPIAREVLKEPWKSKEAATGWSLIPGLGQMYVGEYANGAIRLAVALIGAAMVIVPAVSAIRRGEDLTWDHDWPLLATSVGGLIVLSIDYTTAYQDALRGVVRWNERREGSFETLHPQAP